MDAYITKQFCEDIFEDDKEDLPDKFAHSKLLEWNYFRVRTFSSNFVPSVFLLK